ncbi:MAG: hypothetical protein P8Y18_04500 [Candidatus Bathyarchaeota archaeon]
MYNHTLLQETSAQKLRLSLGIEKIDEIFPHFSLGDFVVFRGSSQSLINILCVRAQLPCQLGGLGTNVVFVDGGNKFRLYDISTIAQSYELDPRVVLERIFISRAFTAYQLTSLILERLQKAIDVYDSKLVILSNLIQLYLDPDIPKKEAQEIFMQLTSYISNFAKNNQVIVLATNSNYSWSKQNKFFKEVLFARANVVIAIKKSNPGPQFVLEKHSQFNLGKAEFPSSEVTLTDFMKV